jgi:hypothetical protein
MRPRALQQTFIFRSVEAAVPTFAPWGFDCVETGETLKANDLFSPLGSGAFPDHPEHIDRLPSNCASQRCQIRVIFERRDAPTGTGRSTSGSGKTGPPRAIRQVDLR